jgi:hypothetical protein
MAIRNFRKGHFNIKHYASTISNATLASQLSTSTLIIIAIAGVWTNTPLVVQDVVINYAIICGQAKFLLAPLA